MKGYKLVNLSTLGEITVAASIVFFKNMSLSKSQTLIKNRTEPLDDDNIIISHFENQILEGDIKKCLNRIDDNLSDHSSINKNFSSDEDNER